MSYTICDEEIQARLQELKKVLPDADILPLIEIQHELMNVCTAKRLRTLCTQYGVGRRYIADTGQKKEKTVTEMQQNLRDMFVAKIKAAEENGTRIQVEIEVQASTECICTQSMSAKIAALMLVMPAEKAAELEDMQKKMQDAKTQASLRHLCSLNKISRMTVGDNGGKKEMTVPEMKTSLQQLLLTEIQDAENKWMNQSKNSTIHIVCEASLVLTPALRHRFEWLCRCLHGEQAQQLKTIASTLTNVQSMQQARAACSSLGVARRVEVPGNKRKREMSRDEIVSALRGFCEKVLTEYEQFASVLLPSLLQHAQKIIRELPEEIAKELNDTVLLLKNVRTEEQAKEACCKLKWQSFGLQKNMHTFLLEHLRSCFADILRVLDFHALQERCNQICKQMTGTRDERKLQEIQFALRGMVNLDIAKATMWKYNAVSTTGTLMELVIEFGHMFHMCLCKFESLLGWTPVASDKHWMSEDKSSTQKTLKDIFLKQKDTCKSELTNMSIIQHSAKEDRLKLLWWWERDVHRTHADTCLEKLPATRVEQLKLLKRPGRALTYRALNQGGWATLLEDAGIALKLAQARKRLSLCTVHYHCSAFILLQIHQAESKQPKSNIVVAETFSTLLSMMAKPDAMFCAPFDQCIGEWPPCKISHQQYWKQLAMLELWDRKYWQLPLSTVSLLEFIKQRRQRLFKQQCERFVPDMGTVAELLRNYTSKSPMEQNFLRTILGRKRKDLKSTLTSFYERCQADVNFARCRFVDDAHFAVFFCHAFFRFDNHEGDVPVTKYSPWIAPRPFYCPGSAICSKEILAMHTDVGRVSMSANHEGLAVLPSPITCELCHEGYLSTEAFGHHCEQKHGGIKEYRKRVFWLLQRTKLQPLKHWVKRAQLQTHAFFQHFSIPSAGLNDWVAGVENAVPRVEYACGVCARLDFPEHRYPAYLFKEGTETCSWKRYIKLKRGVDIEEASCDQEGHVILYRGELCFGPRAAVERLLSVQRYSQMWPLIPLEELEASAVTHPADFSMKWLLHARRVPLKKGLRNGLTPIGNEDGLTWLCANCAQNLCKRYPVMPCFSLCNSMWLGRLHPAFSNLSMAAKMLQCKGRLVMQKLFLRPGMSQTAISGNSILIAQPRAESITKLPDFERTLENLAIIYCKSLQDAA